MDTILSHTIPDYDESCARALADLIAFRRLHGIPEDPFGDCIVVPPCAVLAMEAEVARREAGLTYRTEKVQ